MKILAIESASITASCAISDNDKVLGEYSLSHKKTHSEKLMPLIESLFHDMEISINDIDVIAMSEGPGSYTGLRIGAAIGKSLAFGKNIPIASVPTMKSLASNIYFGDKYIVPVMDAKAGRVYTGIYKWVNKRLTTIKEQFPTNVEDLAEMLNQIKEPVILNGDGSVNYKNIFEEMMKVKPLFSPDQFNYLKASSLACLGYEMAKNGDIISSSDFSPKYLRLSQAERNIK
ncbi:MAG: tRNA (adenosine(37)-N6)-threonylcarbamoyltransferase complex dimerization subunit type 1 TsaB [Tissierellia bacterium]|nr:tRNA (adenosine(37)-N6)-threonylcarbamoyltransferase complex dimerization subunit type 1 TsaB [Tissierellia bacterium]MDD4779667.1 tRNA (adenosine(37)-N6)-threonylcarbamoyltransferase complex dimerization subunit type 1 TsaB [Tissierellia bacterium]